MHYAAMQVVVYSEHTHTHTHTHTHKQDQESNRPNKRL